MNGLDKMDDTKIVKRIIDGDVNLFQIIVDRYHVKVYNLCIGFVHHKHDAEDLTQDVFTNTYISLRSFQGKSSFSTWLYRIALNTIYSFLRQKNRRGSIVNYESPSSSPNTLLQRIPQAEQPDSILNEKQINAQVLLAIDSLNKNQRTAFVLSRYDELSQREIATIMNISERAVESLLQRAKRNLQAKLKNLN